MAADFHGIDPGKGRRRSRVANNPASLPGVDGRSAWSRRFKDLVTAIINDASGPDDLSEQEKVIIRRAAALSVELEVMEAGFATAGATPEQLASYATISGTVRRSLEAVGLRKRGPDPFAGLF